MHKQSMLHLLHLLHKNIIFALRTYHKQSLRFTTKIEIADHLKEYCIGKYNNHINGAVRFPDTTDLYHMIWDLLEKRPASCFVDRGNLEIILPKRDCGKSPDVFNYLGVRSQEVITRRIELLMWAELHDHLDLEKHRKGTKYIDGVHIFMRKYNITSLSEDAFIKNYYRWRDQVRKKERKRSYTRDKNLLR